MEKGSQMLFCWNFLIFNELCDIMYESMVRKMMLKGARCGYKGNQKKDQLSS